VTSKKQLGALVAVLVLTELALHFCFEIVDRYFLQKFAITTDIAMISLIALLLILIFREEIFVGLINGGVNVRRKHVSGLVKTGRFGFVEAMLFIAYVVASLACFSLISLPESYKTLVLIVVCVSSGILLSQKAHIKFTALELLCFAVSVILPLLATGIIPRLSLPPAWDTTWRHVELWIVSMIATVVMAYQD